MIPDKEQFLKGVASNRVLAIDLLLPETEDLYARNPQRLKLAVLAHRESQKTEKTDFSDLHINGKLVLANEPKAYKLDL